MSFIRTTAINKILGMTARKKVIPGGTSAGKTYGILPVLINKAIKKPLLEISIVSESIPHLRKGAMRDFIKIMKSTGRYHDPHWNRTTSTYTFSNGSFIEFFSVDDEAKARGPRRHVLYINEANNISFDAYHQLAIRTSQDIYMDYNPTNEFWVHTELLSDDDVEVLKLTYKDNEALPNSIVEDIEKVQLKAFFDPKGDHENPENIKSSYWANWWKVYGLGELGTLEGVIFNNWQIIESLPGEAKMIGAGLDFGYTNDPASLVCAYKYNNMRIFDERIYMRGLTNPELAKKIKSEGIKPFVEIYADSSEPKSIAELKQYGIKVFPVTKGQDSIRFGVDILLQEPFYVTKESTNLISELRRYMWDKVKGTNSFYNKPANGQMDHAIDAMRYVAMEKLSVSRNSYSFWAN